MGLGAKRVVGGIRGHMEAVSNFAHFCRHAGESRHPGVQTRDIERERPRLRWGQALDPGLRRGDGGAAFARLMATG